MKIEVNGKTIEAKQGETILDAVKAQGIRVPTLCHIANLFPSGACRMCVVEVEGWNNLVPSCSMQIADGMKIKTHSLRVLKARKTILELLLANHPDDCLYCDRNGQCELQSLSEELGVRNRGYRGKIEHHDIDMSSASIVRDPSKCVLCGRCVRVCEEIEGVSAIDFVGRGSKSTVAPAFKGGLNTSTCVNCGQCVVACPTGALVEKNQIKDVLAALNDPTRTVVVQHAPSVSVTIGEAFGLKSGTDVDGLLNAGLRRAGFKMVFDTSYSADLTIMEEAAEFVDRVKKGGTLPMMTSCSPGWVKFVEQFYPDMIPNLSSCKSPQQMLGALIKSYYAEKMKLDPKKIFSVSIMPCTAKKFESGRPEMMSETGAPDIDVALTTRELVRLFKMLNIDLKDLGPETADNPFGERSSAGKIFGTSGGVMEAAVRTAYFYLTGKEAPMTELKDIRGLEGVKEATVNVAGIDVKVAVVSGLNNARKLLDEIKAGRKQIHFIEVMTCPGGCINGGGQPYGVDRDKIVQRMKALYKIDGEAAIRQSHKNTDIARLYKEYLGEPLGHKSHHLLHTHYSKRTNVL